MQFLQLLEKLNIAKLKPYQSQIIAALKNRLDGFVVLPTGYGKSISFQVAPFLVDGNQATAIIVMPLVRLMKDQTEKLNSCGCNAVYYSEGSVTDLLNDCSVSHIFVNAETLVHMLKPALAELSATEKKRFSFLFVDESHCVVKWGQSSGKSLAFRTEFSAIGGVRAVIPETSVIALTATATAAVAKDIIHSLHLATPFIIRASPERINIRYSVINVRSTDVEYAFQWLNDHLTERGYNAERMLIFCKMLKHIGLIYEYLSYHNGTEVIQMYHTKIPEIIQNRIASKFNDPTSKLRIVVCSSSFSMGIDIPALYSVIHYGMPVDIDQYVQESGRIGRDGHPSQACVINHRNANVGATMTVNCKEYVKSKSCRRIYLLEYFGAKVESPPVLKCLCCDNCIELCNDCNHQDAYSLPEKWFYKNSKSLLSSSDESEDELNVSFSNQLQLEDL